ncbi:hypothetical protein KW791_00625 [Candidatus Parcubacteria bacterium]|nr:hypothetical protein [Candidatus Parcubacteria bacterium]
MNQFLSILKLEPLKGSRTQFTILAGLVINILVQIGFIHWTPDQVKTVNDFLTLIAGYFLAEKLTVSK